MNTLEPLILKPTAAGRIFFPLSWVDDVSALARALIPDDALTPPHVIVGARNLVTALIGHVCTVNPKPGRPPYKSRRPATLGDVRAFFDLPPGVLGRALRLLGKSPIPLVRDNVRPFGILAAPFLDPLTAKHLRRCVAAAAKTLDLNTETRLWHVVPLLSYWDGYIPCMPSRSAHVRALLWALVPFWPMKKINLGKYPDG